MDTPDPLADHPDALTPDEVAHLKGIGNTTVRLAIRQGRLPGFKVHTPGSVRRRGPGRYCWRVWRADAEAWNAEARQPKVGVITVGTGPKREGELSPTEAASLAGTSDTAVRNAIRTGRLSARWAPLDGSPKYAVPRHGNTHEGNWYLLSADVAAWHPGPRRAGGAPSVSDPDKAADELTVSAMAKARAIPRNTILDAIRDGRLPARWVPHGMPRNWDDPRPPVQGEPGRWLIKRTDAEAFTVMTPA